MAGVYRPRHPERTVLYRVLFHYFDRFRAEYERRFEKKYGFFRPIIKEVVERYLDCGNQRCGFARIRCPSCGEERLLMFSCPTRGFCPSCHAKRVGKYMIRPLLSLERLSLDEKHGHVCYRYGEGAEEVERMDYLEFIARVVSHIPDKGQVTVRYYGLC
ncbi:MAG: transposase zinc-binding domain-containing protein [Candidatus Aminicenantales bacterium]